MTTSKTDPPQKCPSISKPLIADLPQEIIAEILSFLPVKTLIKFRCVCKSWLYLISNPKFINTHLIKSSNLNNFTHHRLIFRHTSYNLDPFVYYLRSCSIPNNDSINPNAVVALDYPSIDPHVPVSIIGSSNGLVCIAVEKGGFFIRNPSTRKSKELPAVDIKSQHHFQASYGFGYDQLNDDYKLVLIMSGERVHEGRIYSLKNNSWGKIGNFPRVRYYDWGKYVNGKLHWMKANARAYDPSMVIVSLNLGNETYGEIAQPCYGEGYIFGLTLGVLEGCLSVCCHYNRTFERKTCLDIWVMKEYGVSDTWIKLYAIPRVSCPGFALYYQLSVSVTGEILLKIGRCLVLYDPNNGRFRNPNIGCLPTCHGRLEATTYVESLVSPNINDEVPNPQH